jgi:hypothetical protein
MGGEVPTVTRGARGAAEREVGDVPFEAPCGAMITFGAEVPLP